MKPREWIAFPGDWRDFEKQGLNLPGTRIDVQGEVFLIGDINIVGGVCNDCMGFSFDAPVLKYLPPEAP